MLTADRPPELRDIGAGQAIDQLKLYGDAVKWFFEVGVARRRRPTRCAGSASSRAARTGPPPRAGPGPVHLNFPLREPLVLDAPAAREDPVPGRADGRAWVQRAARDPPRAPATLAAAAARPRPRAA